LGSANLFPCFAESISDAFPQKSTRKEMDAPSKSCQCPPAVGQGCFHVKDRLFGGIIIEYKPWLGPKILLDQVHGSLEYGAESRGEVQLAPGKQVLFQRNSKTLFVTVSTGSWPCGKIKPPQPPKKRRIEVCVKSKVASSIIWDTGGCGTS
jgi:hypothetical protein